MSTLKVNTIQAHTDGGHITIASPFDFAGAVTIGTELEPADLSVSGNISIGGNITLGNDTLLGDGINDTVTFDATIDSHLLPQTAALNIGAETQRWHDLWLNDALFVSNNISVGSTSTDLPLYVETDSTSLPDNMVAAIRNTGAATCNLGLGSAAGQHINIMFVEDSANLWTVGAKSSSSGADPGNFRFRNAADNTALVITQAGFVGVGLTNPSTPLEVAGTITAVDEHISNDLEVENNAWFGNHVSIGQQDDKFPLYIETADPGLPNDLVLVVRNTNNTVPCAAAITAGNTQQANLQFKANAVDGTASVKWTIGSKGEDGSTNEKCFWFRDEGGNPRLVLTQDGFLGLGVVEPDQELVVSPAADNTGIKILASDAAHVNALHFASTTQDYEAAIKYDHDTQRLFTRTNNINHGWSVNLNGQVGVGVEDPTFALQLNALDGSGIDFAVTSDDGTPSARATLGKNSGDHGRLRLWAAGDAGSGATCAIQADAGLNSWINSGGNFGVGTDSPTELLHVNGNLRVGGTLLVEGNTTTIDSVSLVVEDKNIELGVVDTPTDTTADGGGITLRGATNKTIEWLASDDNWHFNKGLNVDGDIMQSGGLLNLHSNGYVSIAGEANVSLDTNSDTHAINIGVENNAASVNVGTAGAKAISVGNSSATEVGLTAATIDIDGALTQVNGTINLQSSGYASISGEANVSIETNSNTHAINIGAENKNASINIGTNGTRAITIANVNSNVGIGTTSPLTKLHVDGAVTVSGLISGVDDPVDGSDAATRGWVEGAISTAVTAADDSLNIGADVGSGFTLDLETTDSLTVAGGAGVTTTSNTADTVTVATDADQSHVTSVGTLTSLDVSGPLNLPIRNVADAAFNLGDHYTVLCDTSGGDVTLTLPDASSASMEGRVYNIKKVDTANSVIVNTTAAQTIDGDPSATITALWVSVTVQAFDGNWYII